MLLKLTTDTKFSTKVMLLLRTEKIITNDHIIKLKKGTICLISLVEFETKSE